MESEYQEAVELLQQKIGCLPHPEYGVINLLPWAVNSDQTNEMTEQVCAAIVQVFADAGFSMQRQERVPVEPSRDVSVYCRMCSTPFMHLRTDESGVANVPAATIISTLAKLDPECPHKPLTLEDHRRKIEEAVRAANA